MLDNLWFHDETLVSWETQYRLQRRCLIGAECGSVNLSGVLFGGCWPADNGLHGDERGSRRLRLSGFNGNEKSVNVLVVGRSIAEVNRVDIPAIGLIPRTHVLGKGNVGVVFNLDFIGVVEDDQIAKLLMTGKGRCLSRHTLLHVTITGNDVDDMIKD